MGFADIWGVDAGSVPAAGLAAFRTDLAQAGYTVDGLEHLLRDEATGVDAGAALRRGSRVPAMRLLHDDRTPAALLARLFLLGDTLDERELDAALPRSGRAAASALGIVEPVAGGMRAAIDVRPYAFTDAVGEGAWWVASDLGELQLGDALPERHVLGVGGASATLAGQVLQQPVGSALDLGTGSGIQALHLGRLARHVVATDLSARALAFARFTLALNEVGNVELRAGSLFEPVAGERFDRIVSNPPFVITPRADGVPAYEYRDGGMTGDGIVEAVVRGAAAHLEPGGTAQLLGNWETIGGRPGLERVRGWAEDAGLEYWIVERELQDPAEYAETWIRDGGTKAGTAAFEDLEAAWLDDFAARGVTAIGFGYVLLRRPSGIHGTTGIHRLARAEAVHTSGNEALAAHFGAVLAAAERIAGLSDAELASLHLRVAPDVTEERHHLPGHDEPSSILLRQGGGFGRVVDAGTALAAFVGAADGELPAGVIADAIAELTGVDAAALRAELAPQLRELVFAGMLLVP
ncbi:DUF7059 domain-containing protein [Agromyces archimandritae]|uniref:Methyltransferase n=1 Tax=Agromyces archimandritae TaxID=2781962 RepID=A0A975FLD8_9MICO|nr:methyltransferase [Agromyces archimandritae]QTX04047.1 methyltransferase [Agromyces archimandritae]